MFSVRLNGKTIEVRSELPAIRRDHVVLEGIAPNGAPARVTLDGRRAAKGKLGELLLVQASEVTVRWLRFTGVDARLNPNVGVTALIVGQGHAATAAPFSPGSRIANLQIVDDVFDNRGTGQTVLPGNALTVGTDGSAGANTHIRAVTIARNTFRNYSHDALAVLEASSGDTASGVVILDNTFERTAIAIELGASRNASRVTGTRIIGNTITAGHSAGGGIVGGGINLDMNGTNGTIDQTLIEDNVISGQVGPLNLDAAASLRGLPSPAGDVISNTRIVNNVIGPGVGGIGIAGGNTTSSPPSRVSGVTIENDTFVGDQSGNLFAALPNGPGASGNQITGVTVRNSILYEPLGMPIYVSSGPLVNQPPDVVMNSLIIGSGWGASNGNVGFVDEATGDYQLAAGSPAINAGSAIGAPSDDLDGALRDGQPDIGAFEYGAIPRPLLTVTAEQLGGSGTVTTSPAAITCGTSCSARFDANATVMLTAKPDRASRLLGWQHGCSGKGRCTIRLNSAKSITARFAPKLPK